jgi:hypothetical protein
MTDWNGKQVLEVALNSSVLWSVTVGTPYEAERLGTGDESENGTAASSLRLQLKRVSETAPSGETTLQTGSLVRQALLFIRGHLPPLLVNAVLYVLPPWIRFNELAAIGISVITVLLWMMLEYRWSSVQISVTWPVRFT